MVLSRIVESMVHDSMPYCGVYNHFSEWNKSDRPSLLTFFDSPPRLRKLSVAIIVMDQVCRWPTASATITFWPYLFGCFIDICYQESYWYLSRKLVSGHHSHSTLSSGQPTRSIQSPSSVCTFLIMRVAQCWSSASFKTTFARFNWSLIWSARSSRFEKYYGSRRTIFLPRLPGISQRIGPTLNQEGEPNEWQIIYFGSDPLLIQKFIASQDWCSRAHPTWSIEAGFHSPIQISSMVFPTHGHSSSGSSGSNALLNPTRVYCSRSSTMRRSMLLRLNSLDEMTTPTWWTFCRMLNACFLSLRELS